MNGRKPLPLVCLLMFSMLWAWGPVELVRRVSIGGTRLGGGKGSWGERKREDEGDGWL